MKKIIGIVSTGILLGSLLNVDAQKTLDASDPMTWLVKSVCVDRQDHVVPIDPYGGCPAGTTIRKIRIGDPLPYHNLDQQGIQEHDSYPLYDVNGRVIVLVPFDYQPFNVFNRFTPTDGYDIYAVRDRWVTAVGTSAGGYGTVFYGSGCNIGNGWNFFPAHGFQNGGKAIVPIMVVHWEQSGQSFPGACPPKYNTDTLTSWKYQRAYSFGGVLGNPVKTMDTMIAVHGFRTHPKFLEVGHLETFYFTKEYGITRWEAWVPVQQNPVKVTRCRVPDQLSYQGVNFVVTDCRDWSRVEPASSGEIPVWPIPHVNILQHAHFDPAFATSWQRSESSVINWSRRNSSSPRDTKRSPIGVCFLAVNRGKASAESEAERIYQDIPAGRFISGDTYIYGLSGRAEGEVDEKIIQIGIQQLDAKGNVLWEDTAQKSVNLEAGRPLTLEEKESAYLSSAFVHKTVKLDLIPGAVTVRYYFTPVTPVTFDILEAWFARWPVPAQGLAPPPPGS